MSATTPHTSTTLAMRGPGLVPLDTLAREAELHPVLVRRLIALGLVRPSGGTRAAPLFDPGDARQLRQAVRLRRDLGLNYAGAVLAVELLARIDELQRQIPAKASTSRQRKVITWTRTA